MSNWIRITDDDTLINPDNVTSVMNDGDGLIKICFVDGLYLVVRGTTNTFEEALTRDESDN